MATLTSMSDELTALDLKSALRSLVRPVAIVTAIDEGRWLAMAATAFCEVSLDPPSMLVCVNRSNATFGAITRSGLLGLSVLAAHHEALSRRCGGGVPQSERFATDRWRACDGRPPLLEDGCAAMTLAVETIVNQGTHAIVVGKIAEILLPARTEPLSFHDGAYLRPLTQAGALAQTAGT